jgi:amino acid transporter
MRKTHPLSFLLSHPAQTGGFAYLPAFASSALMSAWTIGGFEAAANIAEETVMPQKRIPMAIIVSEVASVLLGFPVLVGFTLAIPSLQVASHHATPLLYIMSENLPPWATNCAMLLVFLSIFACGLANITTLSRMVWAMARDGQLPASAWLARVSGRKVPANAIWTVAIIAAIFTCWAQIETVITGICTITMYLVYGIVVAAALWESTSKAKTGSHPVKASRTLCIAALLWILLLLGMLSIPRSSWINVAATAAALAAGSIWYVWGRPKRA